ncbi:hypothetical protein HYH02_004430 [Chlamydomonas schloesseri]|uniref:F-box domain-containing protein n=1 Tax=Chlamydomonas schloesseri TaxID=2026947 RepID=A0A836B8I5_9CHLO|nr:hypothetical protein HYH02_004430 [Chlamydomonas schloesseri]|eukprot:KAG2450590.1 hypothetical protein HYH02_004430 [Chlamydomonas schloesseri]
MRTRQRAKAEAGAFTDGLVCWLPEEVQGRLIDFVLEGYTIPVLRNGLVANPARDLVSLMLVCRSWRDRVCGHRHTAARQASAAMLKVAWLTDAALMTGLAPGGQSKSRRLNRIPRSLRLLLHCGCRGRLGASSDRTRTSNGTSSNSPSSSDEALAGAGGCGGGAGAGGGAGGGAGAAGGGPGRPAGAGGGARQVIASQRVGPGTQAVATGGTGGGGSNSSSSSSTQPPVRPLPPQCACAGQGGTRWVEARVLARRGQRSDFERSSFPERVPVLALAAADVAPGELRGTVMEVMAALDGTFLCPFVVRLTFPGSSGGSNGSSDGGGGGGSGGDGDERGGSGGGGGGAPTGGAAAPAADSGGVSGRTVQDMESAGQLASQPAAVPAVVEEGERGVQGPSSTLSAEASHCVTWPMPASEHCGDVAGVSEGQRRLPMRRLLQREEVEALACGTVALGRDGLHWYLVPTAAALRRSWVA